MPVYDNTSLHEMNELLQQMKELHAPDRCEGIGNDVWRGLQKVAYMGRETPQQKIEKKWKASSDEDQKSLMKMTTTDFASRHDLWKICNVVDASRKPNHSEEDLKKFIDECKPDQLQKMFDIMIVQMTWRDRLLTAWGIK